MSSCKIFISATNKFSVLSNVNQNSISGKDTPVGVKGDKLNLIKIAEQRLDQIERRLQDVESSSSKSTDLILNCDSNRTLY